MRPLLKILALLIASCSSLVVTASPCLACGCTPRTPRQIFRQSDAAFVGRVVDQRAVDANTTVQSFQVEGVYKGLLGPTVDVVAQIGAGGGSDCAVLFPEGSRVAVMLQQQGDAWTTDGCSLLTLAQLRRVAPSQSPPLPALSGSATPTATASATVLASPPGPGPSRGVSWQAVVAGALLAIGAIAFVLSRENRRAARIRPFRSEGSDPQEGPGEGGNEPPDPS